MPTRGKFKQILALTAAFFIIAGCSLIPISESTTGNLPAILTLDELLRPYHTLGRIQVTRVVYFSEYTLTPNLQEWGIKALREEARKMGADALILPEVTSRQKSTILLPAFDATEYRATGTAIKFN
jgi:hypothetical protein